MNKQLTLSIDKEVLKQFRIKLIENEKTQMSSVVEQLMIEYVKSN